MASLYAALGESSKLGESEAVAQDENVAEAQSAAPTPGKDPAPKQVVVVPTGWSSIPKTLQPNLKRRAPPPKPRAVIQNAARWASAANELHGGRKKSLTEDAEHESTPEERPALRESLVDESNISIDTNPLEPRVAADTKKKKKKHAAPDLPQALEDIYEPVRPNDYYEFKKELKRRKEELRNPPPPRPAQRHMQHRDTSPRRGADDARAPPLPPHRSVTPPRTTPMDVEASSGEEAFLRRQQLQSQASGEDAYLRRQQMQTQMSGEDAYLRRQQLSQVPAAAPPITQPQLSNVVLLTNMVGAGEVDPDLEQETAEECGRFGKVVRCAVFEVPYQVPDNESVRIFVEFADSASAARAQAELNGRFFGGRVVQASFYDMDR
ncbi:hypothetical protein HDU85_006088 [Gaertneriomyces sp. JEL0708]|nr:hypothetical protein HDU85_006088 [Gaertneriomyces sp. JEL0708]